MLELNEGPISKVGNADQDISCSNASDSNDAKVHAPLDCCISTCSTQVVELSSGHGIRVFSKFKNFRSGVHIPFSRPGNPSLHGGIVKVMPLPGFILSPNAAAYPGRGS